MWKTLLTTLGAAVVGGIVTIVGAGLEFQSKDRELDIKLLEIALGILREKPENDQISGAREWAVDVLSKYSDVPVSDVAKSQLVKAPLTIGHYWAPKIDAAWNSMSLIIGAEAEFVTYPDRAADKSNANPFELLSSYGIGSYLVKTNKPMNVLRFDNQIKLTEQIPAGVCLRLSLESTTKTLFIDLSWRSEPTQMLSAYAAMYYIVECPS